MNHEELILKYFNKTLSKDEESRVSHLLEKDTSFKTLFEEHSNMHMAFKINEQENLTRYLKNIDINNKHFSKKILTPKIIAFATACCLIISAFYFVNNTNDSSNIYEDYFNSYPNVLEPVVRGETTVNNDAFIAYENKNYSKAETLFNNILKKEPNADIEFYYAMSLLNQNKTKEAQEVLNLLKSKKHEFIPEVYWYSALISIKNNDYELAKKEITALNLLDSNFKKTERIKLLNQLK